MFKIPQYELVFSCFLLSGVRKVGFLFVLSVGCQSLHYYLCWFLSVLNLGVRPGCAWLAVLNYIKLWAIIKNNFLFFLQLMMLTRLISPQQCEFIFLLLLHVRLSICSDPILFI